MDVIEQEDLLAYARDIGPYFQRQIKLSAELPLVGDVRGIGLLACIECVTDPASEAATPFDKEVGQMVDRHCYDQGLIVRPIGNMCVLSPPLVIRREEVDRLVAILRESIVRTQNDLRAQGRW